MYPEGQPKELTVTTEDGELIASISLEEGNGIVKNGYKVIGFDHKADTAERK